MISAVIGVIALILVAAGVVRQLQTALNTIWSVEPKPGQGIWGFLRQRFVSYAMLLGIGFLLLVSLVVSAAAASLSASAEKSKPHPDIFDAALEELGDMSRNHVIVIGDTPYDAEAAHKAQLRTVGLLSGGWHEKDLSNAGCIAIYCDPADLLASYESSPLAGTN